jgi:hypothetical protein
MARGPRVARLQSTDENFYGTTFGGADNGGTVFKISPLEHLRHFTVLFVRRRHAQMATGLSLGLSKPVTETFTVYGPKIGSVCRHSLPTYTTRSPDHYPQVLRERRTFQ